MLPSLVAARDIRLTPLLGSTATMTRGFWLSLHEALPHIGRVLEVEFFLTKLIQGAMAKTCSPAAPLNTLL